jgi:hypothetical protein
MHDLHEFVHGTLHLKNEHFCNAQRLAEFVIRRSALQWRERVFGSLKSSIDHFWGQKSASATST